MPWTPTSSPTLTARCTWWFGTTDDGLAHWLESCSAQRIRIDGDSATTTALVSRWVLELLATHPDITIGVTTDVWRGPLTTRVQAVAVGQRARWTSWCADPT
jgi:hypothetical protein